TSAVVLLPFVVVRRLNQPEVSGSWWAPVLVAGLLVVSGGEDPVLLSSCGLLMAADLARQQPAVPPESLVAGAMLMTAWLAPAELSSLEALTMVMLLAGMAASSSPFATSARSVWSGVLLGLSCGLVIAELWVHFFPLG
ncbi:MAG: hypothetical protein VYB14_03515, partial [Planctomycetota bacterium]|nr:hypothetical protein [Planctomycetota bacterium]